MALQQSFCLFVLATLYGVCQAQCVIRTLMPMTMLESCAGCGMGMEESQSSTADDLSALLMLARALEMDRAASANCGVDVNGLLNTLVHALVYTATHNGGKGSSSSHPQYPAGQSQATSSSSSSSSSGGSTSSGNKDGLLGGLLGGKGGDGGSGGSGKGDDKNLLGGLGNTVDGLLGGLGSTVGNVLGGVGGVV